MNKRLELCAVFALLAYGVILSLANAAPGPGDVIATAVRDSTRPPTDIARDADRKPAATLAFAAVKPGDIVADYAAGSGYFSRSEGVKRTSASSV